MEHARDAQLGDLARITELGKGLHDELAGQRGGQVWSGNEAIAPPFPAAYRRYLEHPGHALVAGCIDDVVVGYGTFEVHVLHDGRRIGLVRELYVEPGAREVGVGEAIVECLLARARAEMCIGVDAIALPGGRAAKNFFEDMHFTARALVMHHELEPSE
jgi:GNAT superfamily N-acetyltransferase